MFVIFKNYYYNTYIKIFFWKFVTYLLLISDNMFDINSIKIKFYN